MSSTYIYIHICVFLYGFFPLINGMWKLECVPIFEACLCCVLFGANNDVTLLIAEVADCQGSGQSCYRVGWRAAGLLLLALFECHQIWRTEYATFTSTQTCVDTLTICCGVREAAPMWSRHGVASTQLQTGRWSGDRRCSGRDCVVLGVRTLSVHKSLMTWSETDRLHVKVTPRTFSEFSRVMLGSGCGVVLFCLLLLS